MKWFVALLLSVALVASASPGHAGERRPAVQSAYLVGLDIHTPSGRIVHVPLPEQRYSFTTLFGRTAKGWLIGYGCDAYLVAKRHAKKLPRVDLCSLGYGFANTMTDDRRYLLTAWDQRGTGITMGRTDLADPKAEYDFIEDAYRLDGGTADKAYVATYGGLVEVDLLTGDATEIVRRGVPLVDVGSDTLFVVSPKDSGFVGPTRLSDPGQVSWRQEFLPTDVSPDVTYVLGTAPDYKSLQVRRMSDGRLVRTIPQPDDFNSSVFSDVGWDTDHSVVMVKVYGKRRAIVRCPVPAGRCRRVTRLARLAVSLPTWVAGPHEGV